jgi:LacI family transcriptional regulator
MITIAETPSHRIDRRVYGQFAEHLGVFAATNLVAPGLVREFDVLGIRVPDDIAIVGYDDIDWARSAPVPLTSITQPRARIAEEAMRLILAEESEPEHQHEQVRLLPEFVLRASTIA